jgi:hypothetical protein
VPAGGCQDGLQACQRGRPQRAVGRSHQRVVARVSAALADSRAPPPVREDADAVDPVAAQPGEVGLERRVRGAQRVEVRHEEQESRRAVDGEARPVDAEHRRLTRSRRRRWRLGRGQARHDEPGHGQRRQGRC